VNDRNTGSSHAGKPGALVDVKSGTSIRQKRVGQFDALTDALSDRLAIMLLLQTNLVFLLRGLDTGERFLVTAV
jgi:hypothetical protein